MKNLYLKQNPPVWQKTIPAVAGTYNLVWCIWLWLFPQHFMSTQSLSNYFPLQFWLGLSVLVALLGFLYLLASACYRQLWYLLAFGAGSKIAGAIGAGYLIGANMLPPGFAWAIVLNDLLWLTPFLLAFYHSFKQWQSTEEGEHIAPFPDGLDRHYTQHGQSLLHLQRQQPVLLVFLRHFGCTFCREALGDLAGKLPEVQKNGVLPVFVHMGTESYASDYFKKYKLQEAHRVSDPACALYRTMHLKRASFTQVFGVKAWLRGAGAFIRKGHGIGRLAGDGFRMPGVFLVHNNKILKQYRHRTAADVPDYQELSVCPVEV